jgi:hypothetical protein
MQKLTITRPYASKEGKKEKERKRKKKATLRDPWRTSGSIRSGNAIQGSAMHASWY